MQIFPFVGTSENVKLPINYYYYITHIKIISKVFYVFNLTVKYSIISIIFYIQHQSIVKYKRKIQFFVRSSFTTDNNFALYLGINCAKLFTV
jgi:type IV secretory pathway TraG/TraD family ATPase VirD4